MNSLLFIGTGAFGAPILEKLVESANFKMVGAVTAPDKPAGRKLTLTPSAIKIAAQKHQLPVYEPEGKAALEKIMSELKPDICLVVAYGMIMSETFLKMPRFGCVNVHGSLLPKYRGASPIHEALLNGDTSTGVTWTKMIKKLDAGPIIAQKEAEIGKNEAFSELYTKLAHLAAEATPSVLHTYIETGIATPQDDTKATFCSKIDKSDGFVDFEKENAADIHNKYRAYSEWPQVYFKAKDMNIKIIHCVLSEQNNYTNTKPGTFINLNNKKLLVQTVHGVLELLEVQPPSKKPMSAVSFLQGYKQYLTPLVQEL